jgi:hypothetical protein
MRVGRRGNNTGNSISRSDDQQHILVEGKVVDFFDLFERLLPLCGRECVEPSFAVETEIENPHVGGCCDGGSQCTRNTLRENRVLLFPNSHFEKSTGRRRRDRRVAKIHVSENDAGRDP